MFGLSYTELLSCLAIGVGICITVYAFLQKSKNESLLKDGEKAEGIVFQTGYRESFSISSHDSTPTKDKITIRFVTKDMQWITADIDGDFVIYYTGQYNVGDKVNVIYNPENPREFAVTTGQSETLGRVFWAVFGIVLFIAGAYFLFAA